MGCTDPNADNYDPKATKNGECRYRYSTNISIIHIPGTNNSGIPWDEEDGPDIRVNFGKKDNPGYDFSTTTALNAITSQGATATITPNAGAMFTNEDWKYEIIDVDLLGNDVISSGIFNPLKSPFLTKNITLENNGVTIRFNFEIK